MYYLRVWVGSIMFALGIAVAFWFIRNLFRPPEFRARVFDQMNKLMWIIFILAFIVGGMWIHSNLRLIPLIALIVGLVLGWALSR